MVHVGGGRFRQGEGTPPYARVLSGVVGRPALWPPRPFAAVGGCAGALPFTHHIGQAIESVAATDSVFVFMGVTERLRQSLVLPMKR